MDRKPQPVRPCDPSGRQFFSDREFAEFKRRQQLRENSVEIRDLEAKLRQAYINKELALQKKQKETLAFQKEQERKVEAALLEETRRQILRNEKEAEKKDWMEKVRYKQKLDGQLDEKQEELNKAYTEFLREKAIIDDIIAQVKEEERKKTIEALVKKQVEKEQVFEFIESQNIFVEIEKDRVAKENDQIQAYIARREAWVSEQEKTQKERKVLKNEEVQRLGEKLEAERVLNRQKEALLHELNEGRQRELDELKERHELEREIRKRLNFRKCNEIAQEYRDKIRAQEIAEDEMWKKKIMEEAEKEAKLDQMSYQKRRMKILELRREGDRLLAEKQKIREVQKMEEKLYWMEHKEAEKQRDALIEQERQKILREHADKLLGFLPLGILSEDDLERLGRDDIKLLYKSKHNKNPLQDLDQQFSSNVNY